MKQPKPAQYAVMLHGRNLIIPSSTGEECIGGVHTWRYVRAADEKQAVKAAIDLLAADQSLLDHIRNPKDFPPSFQATRVVFLERDDLLDGEGTGLAFYIDPDEQAGH